jgi:hypothetical protein
MDCEPDSIGNVAGLNQIEVGFNACFDSPSVGVTKAAQLSGVDSVSIDGPIH